MPVHWCGFCSENSCAEGITVSRKEKTQKLKVELENGSALRMLTRETPQDSLDTNEAWEHKTEELVVRLIR